MKKIKLNFIISEDNDLEEFYNLWKNHENLRKPLQDFVIKNYTNHSATIKFPLAKKEFRKIIDEIYKVETKKITPDLKLLKDDWKKVEHKFYQLTDKIFKRIDLSGEKYDVYPSVLPFYVRNLHKKRISVPYGKKNKKEPSFVLAHELLHVIFYSYLFQNFKKYKKIFFSKKVWDFSEALNVVIQGQDEWMKIFSVRPNFYPEHEKLYFCLKSIWEHHNNIDKLIKIFLEMDNSK
jgi:hypothetical protein